MSSEIVSCEPKQLYKGDKFTISLEVPHGADFLISGGKGLNYEVCFWYPKGNTGNLKTLYEYQECETIETVELIAGVTKIRYIDRSVSKNGVYVPQYGPVFRDIGEYEVIVSPNIETEDALISQCKVKYLGEKP
ncbi:hypothetical protein [uncultured Psychrosphaera sp.]|uniref:hypothetical protein n=1 Tax=uncultured Psychrosphaera sp. TaxID=1403522 RepID=UPI0026274146|nr:hypothetical protein [uncultured Psychrosphaera sp.]